MSIDRREDAGDFYPGGKVISTRPVATGGDVKHSDFNDLDVKTNTLPDLREAVRELGRRLGATVLTSLVVCMALGASVQTVPINDLDLDANPSIVTNVVFDAPPDFSMNNAELVETIEATAPAPGDYANVSNSAVTALSALPSKANTNDVELAIQYTDEWNCEPAADESGFRYSVYWNTTYQAWMLRTSDGGATWGPEDINATSFTVDVWGQTVTATRVKSYVLGTQDTKPIQPAGNYALKNDIPDISTKQDKLPYPTNAIPYAAISGKPSLATVATSGSYNDLSNKPTIPTVPTNVSAFNNDAGYLTGYTETDPTIKSWAKANTKPTYTASEVGAATPADVTAAIREQSLGGIWDAEIEVWWTPRMKNGSLTYEATTNVNLNAGN